MKKAIKLLAVIIAASALSSCSEGHAGPYEEVAYVNIHGMITDKEGAPINHLKVTITQPQLYYPTVVYTSIRGEFIADMYLDGDRIDVLVEDIDGQENGGEFESLTDVITLLDESMTDIDLQYRLNRATASESSQQSL